MLAVEGGKTPGATSQVWVVGATTPLGTVVPKVFQLILGTSMVEEGLMVYNVAPRT